NGSTHVHRELTQVRRDEDDAVFVCVICGKSTHDKGLFWSERNILFNSMFLFPVCGRELQTNISGGFLNIRYYLYSDAGGNIVCEGTRTCGRGQRFNTD